MYHCDGPTHREQRHQWVLTNPGKRIRTVVNVNVEITTDQIRLESVNTVRTDLII